MASTTTPQTLAEANGLLATVNTDIKELEA